MNTRQALARDGVRKASKEYRASLDVTNLKYAKLVSAISKLREANRIAKKETHASPTP